MMISADENQSLVVPRSSISCNAPTPIAMAAKPNQSNLSSALCTLSLKKTSRPMLAATPTGTFT